MTIPNNNMNISWQSVWRFYAAFLFLIAFWYLRQVILIVLLSFILSSLLDKPIDILEKKWKGRRRSTLVIYFALGIALVFLSFVLVPMFSAYFNSLLDLLPTWFSKDLFIKGPGGNSSSLFLGSNFFQQLGNAQYQVTQLWGYFTDFFAKILGGAFSIVLVFILSFFMNSEEKATKKTLLLLVPSRYRKYTVSLWEKVKDKVGGWFFSQLLLSFMVGGLAFLAFKIIGLPQAGFLALMVGILDFLPYIGPIFAGIIVFLMGITQSWFLGLLVIVIVTSIQILENVIAPRLRARVMKLNPVLIIVALLVGGRLAGVVGAIIALPLAAGLKEFLQDIQEGKIIKNKE